MKRLSSLLDTLGLKPFAVAGLDVAKISAGALQYAVNGATPASAYQAMVQLHCLTSGYSNDVFSGLLQLLRPRYRLPRRDGILGPLDDARLATIVDDLKTNGYHVFDVKLPLETCDRLMEIGLTSDCRVRAMDGQPAPPEPMRYDRNHLRGVRYDLREQDLIDQPVVQSLMSDLSLLAVAQEYLGSAPILDIVSMWWHTAFAAGPDKTAAQYYHFDMDRLKWLKFFFYLTDVTPDSGPHCFVAGSHRRGGTPRSLLKHGYARLSDEDVQRHFARDRLIELTGPRGTIIAEDTRGLHKGKHVRRGERLMFEIEFTNSLFGSELPGDRFTRSPSDALAALIARYPRVYGLFMPSTNGALAARANSDGAGCRDRVAMIQPSRVGNPRRRRMINSLLHLPKAFVRYLRLFRGLTGNRIFLLMLLNAAMSYAEGIGIVLFFPLFASNALGAKDGLAASLGKVLRLLHVNPSPVGVLPFIVLVFAGKGLLQFCAISYQFRLHAQLARKLRGQYIVALRRLDYRYVVGASSGYYGNLLVNEVNRFGDAFVSYVRTLPPAINVLIFFGIVFLLDWRLTVGALLMGLVLVAVVQVTGKVLARYSRANVAEYEGLSSLLIQMVQAFKYLRTRAGFDSFQHRIDSSADRLAHAQFRSGVVSALTQAISQPLAVVLLAAVVYYHVSVRGQAMAPLVVLLAYFLRMISELWMLQISWQSFYSNVGSVQVVQESLALMAQQVEPMGSRPYPGLKQQLALHDVDFSYVPERPVLRHINLAIERNSTVAFVGESGSGKSTLVDLVTGTLKPVSGSVTVDGVSLAELDLETMRPKIGYVPQEAMLFDDTIANNISLWAEGSEADIRQAAARAQCLGFIDAMPDKLATRVGDRGAKLSGGQRQRIAIARELFKKPEILVLDEATSSLDSESERAIQESIDLLKGQVTILIIAHRLSTIRNADRIFVLHGGDIIEAGSYSELLSVPDSRFRRMCELQRVA